MKEEIQEQEKHRDYYFYINQDLVLTKEEKNRALPRVDYNEYLKVFYKKKINYIYKTYENTPWFRDRYKEKTNIFKIRFADLTNQKEENFYKNNILVKEIGEDFSDKEIKELCEKCVNFKEFNLFLGLKNKHLVRNGIISIEGDLNESYEFIKSFTGEYNLLFEPIILEENVKKSNLKTKNDLENVKLIIKILSDFYELTNETVNGLAFLHFLENSAKESGDELSFYVSFLRKVFLFCYYCVKQFDSFMEMNLKCGKDHIFSKEEIIDSNQQNIFERNISLIKNYEHFLNIASEFASDFLVNEMDKFIQKKDIQVFGCGLCSKDFSGLNFVRTHLNKKHSQSIKDIQSELEFYKNLVSNFDFKLFSRISGIDLFILPDYLKKVLTNNQIRYSERVFSGEINVRK